MLIPFRQDTSLLLRAQKSTNCADGGDSRGSDEIGRGVLLPEAQVVAGGREGRDIEASRAHAAAGWASGNAAPPYRRAPSPRHHLPPPHCTARCCPRSPVAVVGGVDEVCERAAGVVAEHDTCVEAASAAVSAV